MSATEERVSIEDISNALVEADSKLKSWKFEEFEERIEYAKALQRKFRSQEGDL